MKFFHRPSEPPPPQLDDEGGRLPNEPVKPTLPPSQTPPWLPQNRKRTSNGVSAAASPPVRAAQRPIPAEAPQPDERPDPPPAREPQPGARDPLWTQHVQRALDDPPQVHEQWNRLYVAAKNEWDERVSGPVKKERVWQKLAFASMAVSTVAVIGCVILSNRQTIIPHVVEVDREGTVVASYGPDQLRSSYSEIIYRSTINNWIEAFRTVTADNAMQNRLLLQTEAFLLPQSAAHSRAVAILSQHSPYARAKAMVVQPEVVEIRKVSSNTWYVIWDEKITPRTGGNVVTQRFTASIVTQRYAVSEHNVMWNPLGIYISELDFTGAPAPSK